MNDLIIKCFYHSFLCSSHRYILTGCHMPDSDLSSENTEMSGTVKLCHGAYILMREERQISKCIYTL